MNRAELQQIADLRVREASILLAAGFSDGAYYLAGYAVECALKACIAKRTQEHDFPDKKLVNDSHMHDLGKLLHLADLRVDLDSATQSDPSMTAKLDTILDWSEASRYDRNTKEQAADLLEAIESQAGGLLPWIRSRW